LSGHGARLLGASALTLLAWTASAGEIPPAERRSGYDFMSRETRAMQDDDTVNPGMLGVLEGGTLWARKTGTAGRACADCHGDGRASMKGVAARYPAFDAALKRPVNLEQRINLCRTERQQAPALAYESRELLALTAFVARQSRGVPIDVAVDARTKPFIDNGRAAFYPRAQSRSSTMAAPRSTGVRASSTLPAASVTTRTGASGWPATRSPRRIRRAIRSTVSNGRASARSSAGCATAWSGSAPSRTSTARPSSSSSSCF